MFQDCLLENGYASDPNTNVYKKRDFVDINYSDGNEVESRILEVIKGATDLSSLSDELELNCIDWPSTYHLSKRRGNLVRPFLDKLEGKKVLEIGSGMGAITRVLGESGAEVLALEGTCRRAEGTRSRTRDQSNVLVLAEKFDDFQINFKFDFVTLIGVLEYANLYTKGSNSHLSMLRRCFDLLNPNGVLIIAIENKLGLKYFAGAPEDHMGIPMFGIEDHYRSDSVRTFGKNDLNDLLLAAGFNSAQFNAPLPDYKLTTSLITSEGFKDRVFDSASLTRDTFMQDPQLPQFINFSPERALFPIHENNLGLDLANSFLVFAKKNEHEFLDLSSLAWHFSTNRKKEFCTKTIFSRTDSLEIIVTKSQMSELSKSDRVSQVIESRTDYLIGRLLRDEFEELFTRHGWTHKGLKVLLNDLRDSLIVNTFLKNTEDGSTLLTGNSIDLLPHNLCRTQNGLLKAFDLEWRVVDPVDLRFVIFRSILSLSNLSIFCVDQNGYHYSPIELLNLFFELLELEASDSEIANFLQLEIRFQSEIANKFIDFDEVMKWLKAPYNKPRSVIAERDTVIAERDTVIAERDTVIAERDTVIAERDTVIAERDAIISSTIWKLFKPYRSILKQIKRM
jgi:2-polyprenyl-3-methyl-5-hydroxy-6-metoxy-1,4-benzoquinol methylase